MPCVYSARLSPWTGYTTTQVMPLRDGDLSLTTSQTLVDTAREERFSPFNLSTAAAVLQNVDILYSLFDGNHGFHGVLTRGDLARCARVSRAFSDAALRVLWRNPLTLRPLWHVLAPPRLAFPEESATTADYYKEVRSQNRDSTAFFET